MAASGTTSSKEPAPPGTEPCMMSMKMMDTYGLKTGPGLKDVVPFKVFEKDFAMKEIVDIGFYSAFHPFRKQLEVGGVGSAAGGGRTPLGLRAPAAVGVRGLGCGAVSPLYVEPVRGGRRAAHGVAGPPPDPAPRIGAGAPSLLPRPGCGGAGGREESRGARPRRARARTRFALQG